MTAEELDRQIAALINDIKSDIDAYDERAALQGEDPTNQITTERAQQALERSERFRGEHDVARAWLTHHADRIWTRT